MSLFDRNDFQRGALDDFEGDDLQECRDFDLPDNDLKSMTVFHSGTDGWGGDYVRLILESGKYYECRMEWMDDDSIHNCFF